MKKIIIIISIYIFYTINAFSENLPQTMLYAVLDGSCCGGEESDPHAVHGIEVLNNGFILSGKSIDHKGSEEGFVIKLPQNMPNERLYLHEEEEYNFDEFETETCSYWVDKVY